ncbi:hypothetical protein BX600DRAFT_306831 [Xylariales sp. PMI_506]|nr:hypothetical protein BX600DRAFT_306831 [Xylariales sp. PMI_506]
MAAVRLFRPLVIALAVGLLATLLSPVAREFMLGRVVRPLAAFVATYHSGKQLSIVESPASMPEKPPVYFFSHGGVSRPPSRSGQRSTGKQLTCKGFSLSQLKTALSDV